MIFLDGFQFIDNLILQLMHTESIYHLFFGYIVALLFFNHSGVSIYDPPLIKLVL